MVWVVSRRPVGCRRMLDVVFSCLPTSDVPPLVLAVARRLHTALRRRLVEACVGCHVWMHMVIDQV